MSTDIRGHEALLHHHHHHHHHHHVTAISIVLKVTLCCCCFVVVVVFVGFVLFVFCFVASVVKLCEVIFSSQVSMCENVCQLQSFFLFFSSVLQGSV